MPSFPFPLRFRRRGRARLLSAAGVIVSAGALLAATSLASPAQASTQLPVNYDFLAGATATAPLRWARTRCHRSRPVRRRPRLGSGARRGDPQPVAVTRPPPGAGIDEPRMQGTGVIGHQVEQGLHPPGPGIGEMARQVTVLGRKVLMDKDDDHSPRLARSASRSPGSGQSVFLTMAASSKLARRNKTYPRKPAAFRRN